MRGAGGGSGIAAVRAVYCGSVTELGGRLLVGRWSRVGEMVFGLRRVKART